MNVILGVIVFLLAIIFGCYSFEHAIDGGYADHKKLRILTWNILAPGWFNSYQEATYGLNYSESELAKFHNMRINNIIHTIKNVNPDVICLQEIDSDFLDQILKNTNYLSTPITLNHNSANEGCATLFNPKIKLLNTVGFLSQNEPNVYTHIKVNEKKYHILNVHLPRGGKCSEALKEALNIVRAFIEKDKSQFIICGDFNSSNKMTEEIHNKYNKYWSVPTTHEYKEYTQLLKKQNMIDSTNLLYTTIKDDGIMDHEDHIYIRKNAKYKVYYGDYLDRNIDESRTDQGENGLLYFTQKNQERKDWDNIHLTSDHRWICIDFL
jgi:exonuclease III